MRGDGRRSEVSLLEAFAQGRDIADLSVRPHERIALMRLLICIAQAALDGPKDEEEWRDCLGKITEHVATYLTKWRGAFELFGDGPRFLQVANLESAKADDDEGNAVDKLDVALSCGNNTTLFDNAGGSDRAFTPAALARMLITFQSFAAGGTTSYAKWHCVATRRSASAAVCIASSPLHAFVRKPNLIETVHANLLDMESFSVHAGRDARWGQPVWHQMPGKLEDLPEATRSYLGRLVPVTRAVWIDKEASTVILGEALIYPSFDEIFADPSTTIIAKEDKRMILRANPAQAIWRQLDAIATLRRAGELGGPLALRNALDGDCFDLWAGGLATHPMRIASIVDAVESVYRVPTALIQDAGHRIYADGVNYAKRLAGSLARAIASYRRKLKDEIDRGEGRKRGLTLKAKASLHYWTAAENLVSELFHLVTTPPPVLDARYQYAETPWGKALFSAALEAYDLACPHTTPRQMQAYVLGRTAFFRTADTREPATEGTEEHTA